MGGRSKSSTTSQTTTTTTNVQNIQTTSVGLEDVEFGVVGGGDVAVTQITTDQGALEAAEGMARAAFGSAERVALEGLDTGRRVGEAALDVVGETVEGAFGVSREALGTVERGLSEALDFGAGVTADALSFGERALQSTAQTTQQGFAALSSAITRAAEATRSDTAATLQTLGRYGFVALAVIGGAIALAIYAGRR